MRPRLLRTILACTILLGVTAGTLVVLHAVSISTSTAATENFDGIGTTATAPLPADFRVDRTTTSTSVDVRRVGTFSAAGTMTVLLGGANLSSSAANGIYNFGSGTTTTGPDRAIGFLASGTATASGNLYAQLTNTTAGALAGLQISYDVEKYRNGSNPAGFRIQLFYSTDGTTWTSAGTNFLTSVPADANNNGFAIAPGATVNVSNTLTPAASIPVNGNFYLAWNYSVSSGTTVTNAQALAVDNVSVTGIADTSSTNPAAVGSANPATVAGGSTTSLTVAVTPGTNPPSSGISVAADLSSIGGSATQPFFDDGSHGDQVAGDNVFSFQATVDVTAAVGAKVLPVAVTDAQGRSAGNVTIGLSVTGTSTPPAISATADPPSVPAGQSTALTAIVSPGTGPASASFTVTGDLSPIGGSATQPFQQTGSNAFSFNATVDPATTIGTKTLHITVVDDQQRATTVDVLLGVTAPLTDSTVVISEVYGGGGNSNATYQNDFVQLYNRGTITVDLTGWTLQYASATGTSWTNKQPLGGPIAPGQYYLVALGSGGAIGSPLPPANITGSINMSAMAGKIALVDNGDTLVGGCPIGAHVRDFVGYGSSATCFEGSAAAPAPSNTAAIFRLGGGFIDTNDNATDFATGPPSPLITAPIVEIGPAVLTTDPLAGATTAPRDATIEVSFTEPVDVSGAWFHIVCSTTGAHDSATTATGPGARDHYITPNVNFAAGETCTTTIFKDQVSDQDLDDAAPNTDHLPTDYTWSFTIATGAPPPYPASVHLTMGMPTAAAADINQSDDYLMTKPEYVLSYNRDLGRPNWVSWHLTPEWFGTLSRVDTFRADPQVPPAWHRVQSFSFQSSGFDRGHMTPNADRDLETSIPINQATYLMSNMVAQAPDNNQGPWANLENYLRSIAGSDRAHPVNEIYIVAGPAGRGGAGSNGYAETIDDGHVTVPAYTWKVALVLPYDRDSDDVSRVTCATRTIAVIMPNVQGIKTSNSNDWMNYLTTVDAVEALTGYDFFSNVPPTIQNCIQAGVNGVNPDSQEITFEPIPPHRYGDPDFTLTATASSGLDVTFTVVSGPATVDSHGVVHLTGPGTVTIRATQPGGVKDGQNYAKAVPVDRTFDVAKGAQTISFETPADRTYGDAAFTVSATGGASGNPVTFVVSGSACTSSGANGATITLRSAGVCTITASQDGNAYFDPAADVVRSFVVNKATPSFSNLSAPTIEAGTASTPLGGTLGFASFVPTGSVTIALNGVTQSAIVGADGRFAANFATQSLAPASYGVTFAYGGDGNFNAIAGSSELRVADTTPPVISGVSVTPDTLATPDHTMVTVTVAYQTTDLGADGRTIVSTPACALGVASNEPVNSAGDGNTAVDWLVIDAHHVQLRAERAGGGSGRVYTISIGCMDAAANRVAAAAAVRVPQ